MAFLDARRGSSPSAAPQVMPALRDLATKLPEADEALPHFRAAATYRASMLAAIHTARGDVIERQKAEMEALARLNAQAAEL